MEVESKVVTLDVSPNERQEQFFLSRARHVLYGGAKGGGKSWGIRWKQVHRRLTYPQSRGLLIRRQYPELRRTHIVKLQEELPYGSYRFNGQLQTFTFHNGSVLEMASAPHEGDVMKYQGAEYDDIGIDEATEFTEYMFNIVRLAARTKRTDLKPQVYLGANPGGVGHGWVRRKFINPEIPDPDYAFVPAKVWDNPILMSSDPDYIKQLQSLPPDLRRMYLEGDWDIFAGQAFGEFRREKHILEEPEYPLETCRKIIGFDWGYNAPGCAYWLAYTPDGRVYVYRELYQNQKTPEQWGQEIRIFTEIEPVEYIALPHDCFAKIQGYDSIAEIFARVADITVVRAETDRAGSRKNRAAIMHQYLSDAPDGKPYLQILSKCKNLLRTLPELVISETSPEDVNTEGEDHAYDAVSAALMTRYEQEVLSGAIKPLQRSLTAPRWAETPTGEIQSPDFWEAFKKVGSRQRRTWEHK